MILRTLQKIAIVLEHPQSRAAGLLVRELVASEPDSRGNALSKAFAELQDASDRKSFKIVISAIVGLYQASKGLSGRPSLKAIADASRRVTELASKLREGQQASEDQAILERHQEILAGTLGYAELLRQVRKVSDYSRPEYDAFKARCKRLFKREGKPVRPQKQGRKPRKETIKETLKRPRKQ
jgi:hypothetical protein